MAAQAAWQYPRAMAAVIVAYASSPTARTSDAGSAGRSGWLRRAIGPGDNHPVSDEQGLAHHVVGHDERDAVRPAVVAHRAGAG